MLACTATYVFIRDYRIKLSCKPINEVRASQLAQASERVGSLIPASQQG